MGDWVHEWFYPFRNVAGNVVGVLEVAQDVWAEVRARLEVSTVLNAIPAFVTRVNTEGRFVFIARNNEKYFGPPEKILGRTMREHFGDQYRRTKSARTGGQKGWGLGLTLCRGIANAHGGSVDVESSAELGTTFRIDLPVDVRQSAK